MRRSLLLVLVSIAAACGGDDGNNPNVDAGSNKPIDAPVDAKSIDAPLPPDGPPVTEVTCETLTTTTNTCEVTAGSTTVLLKGNVLTPTMIYKGGQVLVDTTGKISCTGCNCGTGGETVVTCADAVISPGLINTHDHITYTQNQPYTDAGIRYEDRQQWRIGATNRPKITAPGGATADAVRWGELRFLMGGATSIVGSGGQAGILRNLDQAANEEGLSQPAVKFDTFPLDDTDGTKRTTDCNYGGAATTAASLSAFDAYEPHTSEGIDATAHNEFLCESSDSYDIMTPGLSNNLVLGKTAMIHAIGLQPADYALMAQAGTGLIWSPRSNITLYGDTARVAEASRLGINIALGTDWMPSGSMSLLRELSCADSFNATYLGHYFSDQQLWQMVTSNAAAITKTDDVIGTLAMGKTADITIFASHGKAPFRSVIEAAPTDVALVMRGGKILYGDNGTITSLGTASCDVVDVCGTSKRVCLMGEVGKTYDQLKTAAGATIYPAFTCGTPMNEPSCLPKRPEAVAGSTIYTGTISATDADGDGIPDATDNCPNIFNPARPMDNGAQGDADEDGVGDACDPCPLDPNTTTCTTVDPNDRDGDGIPNATDNCPDDANPLQEDMDTDGHGDICDACPMVANPGAQGCPQTIYNIKNGTVTVGTSVHVSNALVTGKGTNGFFVQTKMGDSGYMGSDYSGLFVFTGAGSALLANAIVGQRVEIDGAVANFQNEIELDTVTAVMNNGTVEAAPAAVTATYAEVATGGTRAAKLEGVLVVLPASSVTALDATFGEFTMTAGTTTLVGDDFLYVPMPPLTVGQALSSVTGVLSLRQMVSKLEPRSAADLVFGAPGLKSLDPALSYARVGQPSGPTFPTPLVVTLTGPAQGNTVVMLASGDATALTVPASVTVLDGQTTAVVPVAGLTQSADVTITGMLGVTMAVGHVRVLGATEGPTTVALSPTTSGVAPLGNETLTVTLDLPAVSNTTVNLTASTGGNVPATVTVLANQTTATFTYTDAGATGNVTVTATFGTSTSTATVSLITGANHLVINEVDYDQIGTDTMEFIEIYNPTPLAISLTGIQVKLVNGSNNMVYGTVDLSSGVSLPSLGYLVVTTGATVPAGVIKIDPNWHTSGGDVQNGAPDGLALVDSTTHTVIDALSYEGAMTAAILGTGYPATVSLVEGTVLPTAVADSNTADGSLCRSPNGTDTDNAATDWRFCTTTTIGAANP